MKQIFMNVLCVIAGFGLSFTALNATRTWMRITAAVLWGALLGFTLALGAIQWGWIK